MNYALGVLWFVEVDEIKMNQQRLSNEWPEGRAFPGGSDSEKSAWNAGNLGLNPGSGGSSGEGIGTHFSILAWKNPKKKEYEVSLVVLDAKYQLVSRKSGHLSKMLFININWVWLGLKNSHWI